MLILTMLPKKLCMIAGCVAEFVLLCMLWRVHTIGIHSAMGDPEDPESYVFEKTLDLLDPKSQNPNALLFGNLPT